MDLEEKLQAFQQKYATLEQQSEPGSLERHVNSQIVVFINSAQNVAPAKQRAFETQIALASLAENLDPPRARPMVWEAVKELERIAELHPMR